MLDNCQSKNSVDDRIEWNPESEPEDLDRKDTAYGSASGYPGTPNRFIVDSGASLHLISRSYLSNSSYQRRMMITRLLGSR